jgi:7,8-dihydroneopterin aldolase/epimerase/oxygenase
LGGSTTHSYLRPLILRRMAHSEKNSEDRILLEGMVFHGRHGTLPAERELGQPFVVDVELRLDLRPAGLSDELARTVDYGQVHRRAREIVEGEPVNLTETVAERIAAAVLEDHPAVEAVRVRVAKPHVRLDGTVLAGSAVEILRRGADRG